jgi:hypothetical protein
MELIIHNITIRFQYQILLSLAMPLASVVAADGKNVPMVSTSSMSHKRKQKCGLCTVSFTHKIKIPKSVFWISQII